MPFRRYPQPKTLFQVRSTPSTKLKDSALFVLDTNVLLLPYRVGSAALSDIQKRFQQLRKADRLFVPVQVAREFAGQREVLIQEIYQQLCSRRDGVQLPAKDDYPLLSSQPQYRKLKTAEATLNKSAASYRESVGELISLTRQWEWNDPVSLLYSDIFDEASLIGENTVTEDVKLEYGERFAEKMPPGFKDGAKSDQGIGDYLIWRSILALGREKNSDVIFVSADEKADWWLRSQNAALFPRFELIEEFGRETGKAFQIMRFAEFLNLEGASEDTIKEVREREAEYQAANLFPQSTRHAYRAEMAVVAWLKKTHPGARVGIGPRHDNGYDLTLMTPAGLTAVIVKLVSARGPSPGLLPSIRRAIATLEQVTASSLAKSGLLVVVFPSEAAAVRIQNRISVSSASTVRVAVGFLSASNYFVPVMMRSGG